MFQSLLYETQESHQRWEEHPAYCIPGRGLLQVKHHPTTVLACTNALSRLVR